MTLGVGGGKVFTGSLFPSLKGCRQLNVSAGEQVCAFECSDNCTCEREAAEFRASSYSSNQ